MLDPDVPVVSTSLITPPLLDDPPDVPVVLVSTIPIVVVVKSVPLVVLVGSPDVTVPDVPVAPVVSVADPSVFSTGGGQPIKKPRDRTLACA